MIEIYSSKLALLLIKNKAIQEEEKEVYEYGFGVLLAFILNVAIILSISLILGIFSQTVVFLMCYCPLRQYTGGYHASNYKKCLLVFIFAYLVTIFSVELLVQNDFSFVIFIGATISCIIISIMGPVESENNKLDENQLQKYRKITRNLAIAILLVLFLINNSKYSIYMASALILISVMMILAKKEGEIINE